MFFARGETPTIDAIEERIAQWIMVDKNQGEGFQVLYYKARFALELRPQPRTACALSTGPAGLGQSDAWTYNAHGHVCPWLTHCCRLPGNSCIWPGVDVVVDSPGTLANTLRHPPLLCHPVVHQLLLDRLLWYCSCSAGSLWPLLLLLPQ